VLVSGPEAAFKSHKRVPEMCARNLADARVFVILGGGPAGITCAETLRQRMFGGRIVIVCKEKALPYDRTKLSKAMSSSVESIALRKKEFLDQYAIETVLGVEVRCVTTGLLFSMAQVSCLSSGD
jgi:apoptosis-inducing factor 3